VNYAKTYLTGAFPEVWLYALGALFVVVTLFLPRGIIGLMPTRAQDRSGEKTDPRLELPDQEDVAFKE
jgi:urea transport system permease protein